jgi:lipopolysaccharide export system permease protein
MLLAMGRLYRDAEMPVLTSIGVVSAPHAAAGAAAWCCRSSPSIALCSLWFGPWAKRTSQEMIIAGSRSLLVAGLEPGRFTELPGGGGVVYVGAMSNDGRQLTRVFVYREARGTAGRDPPRDPGRCPWWAATIAISPSRMASGSKARSTREWISG